MEQGVLMQLQDLGAAAAIAFSAVGSALGTGAAGMAAVGAWKKCYAQSKAAPILLVAFVGAPISQTIYGMLLMNSIAAAVANGHFFLGHRDLRRPGHRRLGHDAGQGRCRRLRRPGRDRQGDRELPDGRRDHRDRGPVRHGLFDGQGQRPGRLVLAGRGRRRGCALLSRVVDRSDH